MKELIGNLLKLFQESYDRGDCDDLSDVDRFKLLESLSDLYSTILNKEDVTYCKYRAIKYMGLSRAQFDNLRREGKLPKGIKEQGGTLRFKKTDLDNYIKQKNENKNK